MCRRSCGPGHNHFSLFAVFIGILVALHVANDDTSKSASASEVTTTTLDAETMLDERFAVRPGEMLDINVNDADVSVKIGVEDEVHIQVMLESRDMDWARNYFERQRYRIGQGNGVVRLFTDPEKDSRLIWNINKSAHIRVLVTTPEEFDVDIKTSDGHISLGNLRGDASLRTSDGDITVKNLEGDQIKLKSSDGDIQLGEVRAGRLEVHTSDGEIASGGVRCQGEADFRTSDGNLRLAQIHAETVTVRTSDGDIDIDELIAGSSLVRTSDGSIHIQHLEGDLEASSSDDDVAVGLYKPGTITLKSSNGNITILAPATLPADIYLRGESVRIASAFDYQGNVKKEHAEGRIGGGGPRLEARTSDGTVTLRVMN